MKRPQPLTVRIRVLLSTVSPLTRGQLHAALDPLEGPDLCPRVLSVTLSYLQRRGHVRRVPPSSRRAARRGDGAWELAE